MLDDLKIEAIKKHVLKNTQTLIGCKIQVMFYDLTTIYFEANSASDIKECGFSKDGKSQHVQISLVLIVTEYGMPIGYEIFKGNTFEGSTMIPTLNKLKQQYKVEDVTVIADSAMLSEANIKALIAHRFKFIVSAKIRNMKASITQEIPIETLHQYLNQLKEVNLIVNDNQCNILTDTPKELRHIFIALNIPQPKHYTLKRRV